jgi:hypothetical protein
MQTFRFAKVIRYHEGTNKKSAFMELIPHNHYQNVYLYFSVFQSVITNCFSIFFYYYLFIYDESLLFLWGILRGEPLHGLYHRGQAGSPAVPVDGQSVRQRGGVRANFYLLDF